MSPEEIFTQLSLWIVNLYLKTKSYTFYLHFILYLHVWIRIRIWNTDPDPESSWIRIRIHPHWFCRYVGDLNFFGLTNLFCFELLLYRVASCAGGHLLPVVPCPASPSSCRLSSDTYVAGGDNDALSTIQVTASHCTVQPILLGLISPFAKDNIKK